MWATSGYSAVTMDTAGTAADRAAESRARAARTKRDRTRAALLSAADPAFAARGWARTRVEDIASAAGVSSATAYNHFPTKHVLIAQVYAPLLRNLRTQAYRDITAGRPSVPALTDHLRALVRISWRHRGLTAALSAGIADYAVRVGRPADPGDENDPRVLAPVGDVLVELIARGQSSGELRPWPPAEEIGTMLVDLLLVRAVGRPHDPPELTAELMLTFLFGALRPELLTDAAPGTRPFRT
jgi:AcrR family transcriptional regulator